ncbi:MAG TPA: cytochrome P450 [Steroidobacteraceae bacterium]|nr:cytochrome P450 [Steroidobacteraceae bacterium]
MEHPRPLVLTRHADVMRAALDHQTFSSVVSLHRAVPNGMDPPEHTGLRKRIEPFLGAERVAAFEDRCREIAAELAPQAITDASRAARRYAARAQCAYLCWSGAAADELIAWLEEKERAQSAREKSALVANAAAFNEFVAARIEDASGLTQELVAEFLPEDLASILRNWTVGEIGTIATAITTLVTFLREHAQVAADLRAAPESIRLVIEEVLRLRGPLASNRRIASKPVEIAGERLVAGDPVLLCWPEANLDPAAFGAAAQFVPDRDQSRNLLYGAGIHACPGAALASLELRVFIEEYLRASTGGVHLLQGSPGPLCPPEDAQ